LIYSKKSSTRIEIEDYIDWNVTKKILSHQLDGVNIHELERSNGKKTLIEFVHQNFHAHFNGRDNDKVKALNQITRDLRIPSRSGNNLVNILDV